MTAVRAAAGAAVGSIGSLLVASVQAQPGQAASAAASAPAAARSPVFVLNSLDATISVIDPATWTELRRLPTGKEPHHLYLTPDERALLVANAMSDSITVVDPRSGAVLRTIADIGDPYHLRFSPDMKWLVTAANRLDHLAIYRWQGSAAQAGGQFELVKKVPAGRTPSHLAIDSKSSVVYASLQDSDQLIAVDLATQAPRWTVAVGKMPADVYLAPDDKTLLIGMTGEDVVEAWDVTQNPPVLTKRIKTGAGAHAFRAWGDGQHVLVSNRVANTISRIDLKTLAVVDQYAAPGGPDCIDVLVDPASKAKLILVTSRWSRRLTVIDPATRQIVRQVPVGRSPHGVWTLEHASRR
ncbi:YncE family protein [Caldimonas sp. KR1-144]|uniref:YncE family protein n=1 Tax=Caldimonas sp. KR1-144 TaxID=3400911 RepID=UPI003C075E93